MPALQLHYHRLISPLCPSPPQAADILDTAHTVFYSWSAHKMLGSNTSRFEVQRSKISQAEFVWQQSCLTGSLGGAQTEWETDGEQSQRCQISYRYHMPEMLDRDYWTNSEWNRRHAVYFSRSSEGGGQKTFRDAVVLLNANWVSCCLWACCFMVIIASFVWGTLEQKGNKSNLHSTLSIKMLNHRVLLPFCIFFFFLPL